MKKQLFFTFLIIAFGCSDYKDQKISIKTANELNIFKPEFELSVVGEKDINYFIKISYNGVQIDTFQLITNYKRNIQINFSKINDIAPRIAYNLIKDSTLTINISSFNSDDDYNIDTTLVLKFKLPPIPFIKKISGNNFSKSIANKRLYEEPIWSICPECDTAIIVKASILYNMMVKKSNRPEIIRIDKLPILKPSEVVDVVLELDSIYSKSFILVIPSESMTSIWNNYNTMLDTALSNLNNKKIFENCTSKINSNYIVEDKFNGYYYCDNSIYLVCMTSDTKNYSLFEIGNFIYDNQAPKFNTYGAYQIDKNKAGFEGGLFLNIQHFYGYNPFKIPFIGKASGDVKEIYVDGKKISFQIGKQIFFKQSIHLDNGYNQIPVKVIDSSGNIGEYFIPVTIENMGGGDININNEIYIDN